MAGDWVRIAEDGTLCWLAGCWAIRRLAVICRLAVMTTASLGE